ncbi:MAG: YHS domain-containing protein, partial [Deltaproteobacteria bacterium]|nr:YHS domain-containing protein [Deltaproteobacteria bacterium]
MSDSPASADPLVREIDPVCGMTVRAESPHRTLHEGRAYGFCSAHCVEKFRRDPARYLAPAREEPPSRGRREPPARAPAPPPAAGRYLCPMDPEVDERRPGSCPKCGMALEMRAASGGEEENGELADMRRRFVVAVVFSLPLAVIAMREMLLGGWLARLASARTLAWVELLLATPVVVWAGWPFLVRFTASLANRSLNMFTLIGLGVGVAYAYSVAAAVIPGAFPPSFRGHGAEVAVYFEAAAVIVTLVLLGQVLELSARRRTGAAIRALLGLAPKTARRLADDATETDVSL